MLRRLVLSLLVLSVLAATGAVASGWRPAPRPVAADLPEPTVSPVSLATATPAPTPTAASIPTGRDSLPVRPAPRPEPALAPDGDPEIAAIQRTLTIAGYYVGALDGLAGPSLRSALMAFQKVHDLPVDGVAGERTRAALRAPVAPALREGPDDRVEIDLDRQVLYLVAGGELERIVPVSSGSGKTYRTVGGGFARSRTPVGWFSVERRIRGVRRAPLGVLYDPLYFYKGWAIHGSDSVPAYPASHGCVRVPRGDAVWLFERVPTGMPVHLYGGEHTFSAGSPVAPGTPDAAGA